MSKNTNLQFSRASWVPAFIRRLMPEFLDFIVSLVEANKPFVSLIKTNKKSNKEFYLHAPEVGGSSVILVQDLIKQYPGSPIFVLSDNLSEERHEHFKKTIPNYKDQIKLIKLNEVSVGNQNNEKVLFSINQAHLLSDSELLSQIHDLSELFDHILIGEGNNKSIRQVIGMLILSPLVAWVCAFFVKPFRMSRIVFTYIIQIMPLMIAWDGTVALFKIRSPEKIQSLINTKSPTGWTWTSGKSPNNRGGFVIYLYGKKGL